MIGLTLGEFNLVDQSLRLFHDGGAVLSNLSAAWAMIRPISTDPQAMVATFFKSSMPVTGCNF